jgi:DNA-binding CsgD family transcriptional regulator
VAAARAVLDDARSGPVTRVTALTALARVLARRGESGVWPLLLQAAALAPESADLPRRAGVAAAWAEVAWLTGELERAHDILLGAVAAVCEAAAAPDDDNYGGWLLADLRHWCVRLGVPVPPGQSAGPGPYARQETGDWAGAAELWSTMDCPYDAALALAETRRESDLRDALRRLQALGARPAVALVSRRLRELGARGVSRGPRTSSRANPANLTDREMQVLRLVAEGMRNAEIASRLFVSAKTVDHHVSAILGKLGVRSRAEAARAAGLIQVEDRELHP